MFCDIFKLYLYAKDWSLENKITQIKESLKLYLQESKIKQLNFRNFFEIESETKEKWFDKAFGNSGIYFQ